MYLSIAASCTVKNLRDSDPLKRFTLHSPFRKGIGSRAFKPFLEGIQTLPRGDVKK
jgi:hypothetical protein